MKLTVLLSGLSVAVLCAAVAAAYGEVRQSAQVAASERMDRVAQQLANLAFRSLESRAALVREAGLAPEVQAALGRAPVDSAALRSTLRGVRAPSDPASPVLLLHADGTPAFWTGEVGADPLSGLEPLPPLTDAPAYGPFHLRDGRAAFWSVVPVGGGGVGAAGWIAHLRSLGGAGAATQIEGLIGRNMVVYLKHADGGMWMALDGDLEPAPLAELPVGQALEFTRGTRTIMARARPVDATPLQVVVETPLDFVMAGPQGFLTRMLTVGLLLVGASVSVALVLGRRLSGPIRDLAGAADALAGGDFQTRVATTGSDELARLGRGFNAMATQLAETHRELEAQLAEARSLAMKLTEANAQAEAAREEAQSANQTKADFLATMSHEIRTPINAVVGYTDLLDMEVSGPLNEAQREHVSRIRSSSRLLMAVVNDVLDFAKIESGTMRVEQRAVRAKEVLTDTVGVMQSTAAGKQIQLSLECQPDAHFLGDPQRVKQILVNFLSNSVKFTPDGGAVTLRCTANGAAPEVPVDWRGPWVRLDVEDTGIGIEGDQLARVFEPFVQAENGHRRRHGGTGLGLSISRRLAEMMGGCVTARSAPAQGSCFTLWLRAQPAPRGNDGGLGMA